MLLKVNAPISRADQLSYAYNLSRNNLNTIATMHRHMQISDRSVEGLGVRLYYL